MPAPDPSDESEASGELVRRAQLGDRAAFDELIRRCEGRLLGLVRARLGAELREKEDSTDVVQSALAAAVRDLPRFEYRGQGSFLRWLTTIVEHKVRHHARAWRAQRRDAGRHQALSSSAASHLSAGDPSPSQEAAARETEDRYHEVLEQLEDVDRELLLLHLELGCTHDEIAEALSLPSAEAARRRVARALARLERRMRG